MKQPLPQRQEGSIGLRIKSAERRSEDIARRKIVLVDTPRLNEKALASLVAGVDGEVIVWDVTSVHVFLNVADELAIGGYRTGPLVKAAQTHRPLILLAAELAGNSIKKTLVTTC